MPQGSEKQNLQYFHADSYDHYIYEHDPPMLVEPSPHIRQASRQHALSRRRRSYHDHGPPRLSDTGQWRQLKSC